MCVWSFLPSVGWGTTEMGVFPLGLHQAQASCSFSKDSARCVSGRWSMQIYKKLAMVCEFSFVDIAKMHALGGANGWFLCTLC